MHDELLQIIRGFIAAGPYTDGDYDYCQICDNRLSGWAPDITELDAARTQHKTGCAWLLALEYVEKRQGD